MSSSRMKFESGVDVEKRSIEWKIKNFKMVMQEGSMTDSQGIGFYAGESIGMASNWSIFLRRGPEMGSSWIGIFATLKEPPTPIPSHLYSQCVFTCKNKDGGRKIKKRTRVVDMFGDGLRKGFGFQKFIDSSAEMPFLSDGSLTIFVEFQVFALSKAISPLEAKCEEFRIKSAAKARMDLAALMELPTASNDIKIISSDKKEFRIQKGVLTGFSLHFASYHINFIARSPVFAAMLQTDMLEGNAGVIEIQEIGSEAVRVFLWFLYTGQLVPEWRKSAVLPELTNVAAKYQVMDLLVFLDGVLGAVCDLDNVGTLIVLADLLSLATAKEDLLNFVRRNGVNSTTSFLQLAGSWEMASSSKDAMSKILEDDDKEDPSSSTSGGGRPPSRR